MDGQAEFTILRNDFMNSWVMVNKSTQHALQRNTTSRSIPQINKHKPDYRSLELKLSPLNRDCPATTPSNLVRSPDLTGRTVNWKAQWVASSPNQPVSWLIKSCVELGLPRLNRCVNLLIKYKNLGPPRSHLSIRNKIHYFLREPRW